MGAFYKLLAMFTNLLVEEKTFNLVRSIRTGLIVGAVLFWGGVAILQTILFYYVFTVPNVGEFIEEWGAGLNLATIAFTSLGITVSMINVIIFGYTNKRMWQLLSSK